MQASGRVVQMHAAQRLLGNPLVRFGAARPGATLDLFLRPA